MAEHNIVRGGQAASHEATRATSPWVRLRWIAAALGAATVLASCGTVPGAAVTIDGTEVSTLTVRDRVTAVAGADASADNDTLAAQSRAQLTTIIRHQLTRAAAEQHGITVSESDVNASISQFDDYQRSSGSPTMGSVLGVPEDDVRATVYDLLVFDQLMSAIPADGADVTDVDVTVDAVSAATWADAVAARTKYLADPAAMDTDATAALAANPQLPGGHESLLGQPQHAVFGIFSAAAGEILLVPQGTQGYLVVRVTERTEKPGKLTAQAIANAYQSAGLAAEIAMASLLLGPQADAARIQLNPRFGVWDPRIVQVVAAH